MIEKSLFRLLNHVLAQNTWAGPKLTPFSGQSGIISIGRQSFRFAISKEAYFVAVGDTDCLPDVTISIPGDEVPKLLLDPAKAMSVAKVSGSVEFAESLGFVLRNLRWDAVGDLASLVGDLPAYRFANAVIGSAQSIKSAAASLSSAAKDFAVGELGVIASQEELANYASGVDDARDRIERLEKRIKLLES